MTIDCVLNEGTVVYLMSLQKRANKLRYIREGKFYVVNANKERVLLQRDGSGYKEYISIIDLRLKRYKILLEDGSKVTFEPLKHTDTIQEGYRF